MFGSYVVGSRFLLILGIIVQFVGRLQSAQVFAAAEKKPGALERVCKAIELAVHVECEDQLPQTRLCSMRSGRAMWQLPGCSFHWA